MEEDPSAPADMDRGKPSETLGHGRRCPRCSAALVASDLLCPECLSLPTCSSCEHPTQVHTLWAPSPEKVGCEVCAARCSVSLVAGEDASAPPLGRALRILDRAT